MELPSLVSSLNARVGVILRLVVDARDWDEIPRRLMVGGRVVRVGRFTDIDHKIIATRGPQDHIMLLAVPPHASAAAAESALTMAAAGKNSGRPEEILTASGIDNGTSTSPAAPDDGDRPPGRGLRSAGTDDVHLRGLADTPAG